MPIRHTVKLKKYQDINMEFAASAAITPGHLVELLNTNKVQKHATPGGNAVPKMFALEDELQGKEIDDDYSTDDRVQVWVCQPGEVVYALLKDGENAAIGAALESAGDGTLQVAASESAGAFPEHVVGIALEALNLTDSTGAEPTWRIPVMIV